jgi:hypothetical protein
MALTASTESSFIELDAFAQVHGGGRHQRDGNRWHARKALLLIPWSTRDLCRPQGLVMRVRPQVQHRLRHGKIL